MGSYISSELVEEFDKKKPEAGIICNCGNYAPFINGGSCRFCYGYEKK
tara:strand:- start:404 stop:547 length:144 start_codon:yes stop_codon:yes gene_type:complete